MTALLVTGDAHLVNAISNFENCLLFHDFSCLKKVVVIDLGELNLAYIHMDCVSTMLGMRLVKLASASASLS